MDIVNQIHQFENGLVLLYEEMAWSESFAIGLSVPSGSVWEPKELAGLANMTCEMTNRGAGQYDNRSFLEEFENIGVRSSEGASKLYTYFGATGLCDNWERALELLALQIREPQLSEDELEACKQIQIQEIVAEEDDPDRKVSVAFNSIFLPNPLGRRTVGTIENIEQMTIDDIRQFHDQAYRPNGAVVAVAGRVPWEKFRDKIERLFGDWQEKNVQRAELEESDQSMLHIPSNNAQTMIRVGYRDVPCKDPNYIRSLGGVKILSGGMSSRLFTEVREKRGLCYSVSASHQTVDDLGFVVCRCGTTAESAQQSLDVIVNEIERLGTESIAESELECVKIRLKSSLVMQRESTSRRVGAMMADWYDFQKIHQLEELLGKIDALTCESIESYYAEKAGSRRTRLATLGPQPLELPAEKLF